MNWFKQLFGISDKMETDEMGLPKVSIEFPMPKVKPTKGSDISEPVHVIVKNMLEHPQRWKGKVKTNYSADSIETVYTVEDTKTGQVFKAARVVYLDYGSSFSELVPDAS